MTTLTTIRQEIGFELHGRPVAFTANASGHSTSTLVDDDLSYLGIANDIFVGDQLYAPAAAAADRLRPITAFTASSGTLTVAPVVSGTTVYNAIAYEIWSILDPVNQVPIYINNALKRIQLPVSFSFAPVANNLEQDLTAQQSWLTERSMVRGVYLLPEGGDQQQTITEAGSPGGGTFTLAYRGTTSGNIAYDATAATVQTALRLLPYLGSVTVTRTGTTTNFVWVVTMTGVDYYHPIMTASAASLTGGSSPTITPEITRDWTEPTTLYGMVNHRADRIYWKGHQTYNTTDRLYVRCAKPAYYECAAAAGVYGSQSGLAAETDIVAVRSDIVVFGALALAARGELNTITKSGESALAVQGPRWAAAFRTLHNEIWEKDVDGANDVDEVYVFGPTVNTRFRHTSRTVTW